MGTLSHHLAKADEFLHRADQAIDSHHNTRSSRAVVDPPVPGRRPAISGPKDEQLIRPNQIIL